MTEQERLRQKIMEMLGDMISEECEKSDEDADYALIEKCSNLLVRMTKEDVDISQEKIKETFDRITNEKTNTQTEKRKRFFGVRLAVATFCTAVLLVFSVSAVCLIDENIRQGIFSVLGMDAGKTETIDGITFVSKGILREYDTVEVLLQNEKLDIMYPRQLPEGITLEKIHVPEQGMFPIDMVFNDPNYSMILYKPDAPEIAWGENEEQIIICDKKTVTKNLADTWMALLYDDNITYCISCPSESTLMMLLQSMS